MLPGGPGTVPVPLTFAQERRYHLPEHRLRSAFFSYRIDGRLDVGALKEAVRRVDSSFDALRLVIAEDAAGIPHQYAFRFEPGNDLLECLAVSSRSEGQFDAYAKRLLASDIMRGWDLAGGKLFRLRLLRFSPDYHALLCTLSAMVTDERARTLIKDRLWDEYFAVIGKQGADLSAAASHAPSFIEAAGRQRRKFAAKAATANAAYWRDLLPHGGSEATGSARTSPRTEPVEGDDHAHFPFKFDTAWCERAARRDSVTGHNADVRILAALARTVFETVNHEYVVVTRQLDTRVGADKAVFGNFTVRVPLVLRRGAWETDPLAHVQNELFSSAVHAHVDHVTASAFWTGLARRDTRLVCPFDIDLSIIPARSRGGDLAAGDPAPRGADLSNRPHLTGAAFSPPVREAAQGVQLLVREVPDGLRGTVVVNRRRFTGGSVSRFAERVIHRLANPEEDGTP